LSFMNFLSIKKLSKDFKIVRNRCGRRDSNPGRQRSAPFSGWQADVLPN
jgi:hypothetical protein